jgi:hemerythrin-like domain-containing protein
MMNAAIQNLKNDHVHILRLINVTETIVEKKSTDLNHFDLIVNLIRNYADKFHHAKEENILFPKLIQRGFSERQGPIEVMLSEHVLGRQYVKNMAENILLYKSGEEKALPKIYIIMNGYIDLLRRHIHKEDHILFNMADQVLTSDDQQSLSDQFIEAEKSCEPEFNAENSIAKIDFLCSIYL